MTPQANIAIMNSDVATGRRMNILDGFIGVPMLARLGDWSLQWRAGPDDLRALA